MQSNFSLSEVNFTSSSIWGPDASFVLEEYKDLPFAPFNKLEKLGRFVDVANPQAKSNPQGAQPTTLPIDDDKDFITVEWHMQKSDKYQKKKFIPPAPVNKASAQPQQTNYRQQPTKQQARQQKISSYRPQSIRTKFKDNAGVQTDWVYLSDASKSNFDKSATYNVKVADLATIGKIPAYDKNWDKKITAKKSTTFALPSTAVLSASPYADRFFQDLIKSEEKTEDPTFYCSDVLLSTVLTVKGSMFPWDIQVQKKGNQYILEPSAQNKTSYVDFLTVNENTSGNLPEDEKELFKICFEATNVNRKFINIVTQKTEEKSFDEKSSYFRDVPEDKVYRYRKWTIDNRIHVVCRSEIDSYITTGEGENAKVIFTKLCALNEFDNALDWRNNFESNNGAVISAEERNNACKISKWLCQALLADCELVKLGFVTKSQQKDNKYQILGVEATSVKNLVNDINYREKDNWNIIKTIVELLGKQEDGTFTFVKLPYKQAIRIYRIPDENEPKGEIGTNKDEPSE